ncbi:MAG: rRNA pseudouridine synthase [Treponema sp.]|nr:rRNA pseudouridine synthase [Treponema sp.]
MVRLDKLLANNGFGSRKDVKSLIHSGAVSVNGITPDAVDMHVDAEKDVVCVNGIPLVVKKHLYVMMNKKDGYVCSTKDGSHPTVYELLPVEFRRKFSGVEASTVGRLDVDTEGLLIFTTDGDLLHRLTSPKNNVPKIYEVHLRDSVNDELKHVYAHRLAAGMHIEAEGREEAADCLPAHIEWKDDRKCCLTVREGKYHEVKRMFSALGNEVTYLKRIQMNNLKLDDSLQPGMCRELTPRELLLLDVNTEKKKNL